MKLLAKILLQLELASFRSN